MTEAQEHLTALQASLDAGQSLSLVDQQDLLRIVRKKADQQAAAAERRLKVKTQKALDLVEEERILALLVERHPGFTVYRNAFGQWSVGIQDGEDWRGTPDWHGGWAQGSRLLALRSSLEQSSQFLGGEE